MKPSTFDLTNKRKRLYKRKKRRQMITKATITALLMLSIILIMKTAFKSESNFVATINKKESIVKNQYVICIDPGHGDWDVGTIGKTGSNEKDIVLNIGLKLGKLLEEHDDIKVIYTRTTDSLPWLKTANDSLKERIKISNLGNSDLFISLHCNSNYEDTDSKGIETWYNPISLENKDFSGIIQNELAQLCYSTNRGLKYYDSKDDALAVLEKTVSTSALVELGFISNFQDEYYLNSEPGQTACAEALYSAIIKYKDSKVTSDK